MLQSSGTSEMPIAPATLHYSAVGCQVRKSAQNPDLAHHLLNPAYRSEVQRPTSILRVDARLIKPVANRFLLPESQPATRLVVLELMRPSV